MSESSLSRNAKKNAKKREKKKMESLTKATEEARKERGQEQIALQDPTQVLKEQLSEAKKNGNHKLAAKLRQDLWVLQDVSSGHDPIDLDKRDIEESLERVSTNPRMKEKSPDERSAVVETQPITSCGSIELTAEKELKKLRKKLDQIEKLKKMQTSGQKMESTQIEKIQKENSIKEEMDQLKEMVNSIKIKR